MRRTVLLAGLLLPLPALAQKAVPPASEAGASAACASGTATRDLWANNVRARLFNNGGLFWRGAGSVYNVPAAPDGLPITPNALFAASLWVGGYEGETFRQAATGYGDWEFVPGPLSAAGQPPADCAPYDRIFRVTLADVNAYNAGQPPAPDLRDWPAAWGAPVVDGDGVAGNYNLAGGDRPELLGHETQWWVMNAMGAHPSTESDPFPLEAQVTAFAASSPDDALHDATLYRYRLVWRGARPLTRTWVGLWADADLGNATDDYVGADSARGLVYAYNADNLDEGGDGYGTPPPAVGMAVVQGPLVGGVRQGAATAQALFKSSSNGHRDPRYNTDDWYKRLQALGWTGTPYYRCGSPADPAFASCGPTRFTFTGDPEAGTGWTMRTPTPLTQPLFPNDYRMLVSVGPFDLAPSETQDLVFAVTWARGTDHLNSVTKLRAATQTVQATWATTGFRGLAPRFAQAPSAAPDPLAPGPDATGQARSVRLVWTAVPGATHYEYAVGRAPVAGERAGVTGDTTAWALTDSLAGDVYWRVRGANGAGYGPWSPWRRFRTTGEFQPEGRGWVGFEHFLTTQNATGPLVPPQFGAMDPNHRGFPRGAPEMPDQTAGVQQATNNSRWGLHTTDTDATDGGFEHFEARVLRDGANAAALGDHDYEWRFTGSSVAYGMGGGAVFTVPFELWDIGTADGPADDVRLIPYVEDTAQQGGGPNGAFNLGPDHPTSNGTDDPQTDAVHWMRPRDTTPGRAGYDAYVADVTGPRTLAPVGAEILARTVLVCWNCGPQYAGPFTAALPEPGTVFRIVTPTLALAAAFPSAPTDGGGTGPGPVVLRWYGGDVARAAGVVEVATDSAFAAVVAREPVVADGQHVVRAALETGRRYWWRVGGTVAGFAVPWSRPWRFVAGAPVGVASFEPPGAFAFDPPRPNPAATRVTLRYGLPEAGAVRVEVFDLLGRRVLRGPDVPGEAGWHTATLDVGGLAAGVYVVRLEGAGRALTRSVVVAR